MGKLSVQVLGGFQISSDDQPVAGLDSSRLQSLLSYIILHPLTSFSRRQVAFLFWPDSSEDQALANLRLQIFRLVRSWPDVDQYLSINKHVLQWRNNPSCVVDVHQFENSLLQAQSIDDLKRSLQLYTGELLPGHFDEWILEERNRVHLLYVQALEHLIELFEQDRDYAHAVIYARQLLDADPLNEKTTRRLMTLYALSHDRAAAIRVYHRCAETLMRELEVKPDQDTQEMYELLLSSEILPVSPSMALAFPLVGRGSEWRKLESAWTSSMRGRSHMALLLGEAGIGKTRLAEEMIQWVSSQGIGCGIAHCYAAEGSLAYSPLTEWLRSRSLRSVQDPWLVEIARLLPEIAVERPDLPVPRPMLESWQRQVFFEALASAVIADHRPLLLWIDDLHWCDRDTIEWLHFFLRSQPNERLLILGTARVEEMESNPPLVAMIAALNSSEQITQIPLSRFDANETGALGAHITRREIDKNLADNLYQESEGNPLFIIELLRAHLEDDSQGIQGQDNGYSKDDWVLPPRIQQVINERLKLISLEARELVELAAVLGNSILYPVLASASAVSEGVLVQLMDELWRKGILRERGMDSYAFSHEKIREVVQAGLSQARKRLLHRKAGEAIETINQGATDYVSSQLAYHFDQAGAVERAIQYYLQSARRASLLFSNADAIASLQRGLELLKTLPVTRERDRTELSYQLALGAAHLARQIRAPEVRQDYARAYELSQTVGGEQERFHSLKGLWEFDNYWLSLNQAWQLGEAMLQLADGEDQVEMKINAHYSLGTTAFLSGKFDHSRYHLEEGSRLADAWASTFEHFHGPHPGIGCRARLAWTLCFLGYPQQAFQMAGDAVQLARDIAHPYSQCLALTLSTFLHLMFRENLAAERLADQAITLADQYDYRFWASSARRMRGWATIRPDQRDAWQALLQREDQEWHNVHTVKPAVWFSLSQSLYIEGLSVSGQVEQGLKRLDEVLEKLEGSPELIWEPELYRIKGDLLLKMGASQNEVGGWYQHALETAQMQQSRMLELRAATSLGKLWLAADRKGSGEKTPNLLRKLVAWFPNQLNLPDIQDARSLLAQCF